MRRDAASDLFISADEALGACLAFSVVGYKLYTMSIRKSYIQKLIAQINKKEWWHVPPRDGVESYRKRGKFLASSFREAELYGRPLDQPQTVCIVNPLVGDESTIHRKLFKRVIDIPLDDTFLEKRLSLDSRMKRAALAMGYDSIALMHPKGFAALKANGKIPRSIELNLLQW